MKSDVIPPRFQLRTSHWIWLSRNYCIFEGQNCFSKATAKNSLRSAAEYFHLTNQDTTHGHKKVNFQLEGLLGIVWETGFMGSRASLDMELCSWLRFGPYLLILQDFTEVNITHTHWEGNACADKLAKTAFLNRVPLSMYSSVPNCAKLVFLADMYGISSSRVISRTSPYFGNG
ncbi:uncharacterized protein G2W53_032237 [Senna tora]|uniref:RNase H type-1 domain-containing protein n=1 Tax=Senna tora TaxID=362788 RepID=A0A834SYL4_9FABA|nr:uncharacterized protein G2W53_032237 [Senna tora]